jgi:hypothetical protein
VWPLCEQASDGEGPMTTYGVPGNSDSYTGIWERGSKEAMPSASGFSDQRGLSFPNNNQHEEYPSGPISVQDVNQARDYQAHHGE